MSDNAVEWLRALTLRVTSELRGRTRLLSRVRVFDEEEFDIDVTNTGGWASSVAYVQGDRTGGLELWFDRWTNNPGFKLCICYYSSNQAFIADLASALEADLGPVTRFGNDAARFNSEAGIRQLVTPLPPKLFGRPIAELYTQGKESYLCWYVQRTPNVGATPPRALVETAVGFLDTVVRAVVAAQASGAVDIEYSAAENRLAVRSHLRRERSATLSRLAKMRDAYKCRVCKFSFVDMYGRLGEGYAEAHHVKALAAAPGEVMSSVRELVTVCSNCHRMLHRMEGRPEDVAALRRLVRRRATERD